MILPSPPPLWKAIIVYYAVIVLAFALVGVVGAGGAPQGAIVGLGIIALAHFAPFVHPLQMDPKVFLLLVCVAAAGLFLALRMLSNWARIGIALVLLTAWLGWGFLTLATAT